MMPFDCGEDLSIAYGVGSSPSLQKLRGERRAVLNDCDYAQDSDHEAQPEPVAVPVAV